MNSTNELVEDPIDLELAQKILDARKLQAKWALIKKFYRPTLTKLRAEGLEPSLDQTDINLFFSGDKQRLQSVWQIMRYAGFEFEGRRPAKGDSTACGRWKHPECSTALWMHFTSTVCRRVKVGTRLVEQDIYETICGDAELPPDEPIAQIEGEVQ